MKEHSSTKKRGGAGGPRRTDWSRFDAKTPEEIEIDVRNDPDAAPIVDADWFASAELVVPQPKEQALPEASYLAIELIIVIILMLFGPNLSSKMWYPAYDAVRIISVMEFVENIETFMIIAWFFSTFIKLALYLFITSYATSQWIGIRNWRYVLWFVVVIVIIGSMIPRNMDIAGADYPKLWTRYVFPINAVLIPLLLWIIGLVRKRNAISR